MIGVPSCTNNEIHVTQVQSSSKPLIPSINT